MRICGNCGCYLDAGEICDCDAPSSLPVKMTRKPIAQRAAQNVRQQAAQKELNRSMANEMIERLRRQDTR